MRQRLHTWVSLISASGVVLASLGAGIPSVTETGLVVAKSSAKPNPGKKPVKPSPSPTASPSAAAPSVTGIPMDTFGSSSIWTRDVTTYPVAANSAEKVAELASTNASLYGGNAALNTHNYGVSWYNVSDDQAVIDVRFDDCQGKGYVPDGLYGTDGQFEDVPMPDDAVPAAGDDAQLTVYQPSTDTMWTFWRVSRDDQGRWQACWGGRMDSLGAQLGVFPGSWGTSASGLSWEQAAVSVRDVRRGRIDHAMSLAVPGHLLRENVWPAVRWDGNSSSPDPLSEGMRLRLDPTIDVSTLGLSPIGTMIARAAQQYGFVITDMSGSVAVAAEAPHAYEAAEGADPWPALMKDQPSWSILTGFPWDRLQLLEPGYGHGAAEQPGC